MITEAVSVNALSEKDRWIGRREIEHIAGALKPCAYVARAYKYAQQNQGIPPSWARKLENSQWFFRESHILEDAKINKETMSVHEAAQILSATRRAIQDWVDQGEILVLGGENREKGEARRILREAFMNDVPRLRKRLETVAVVARKLKNGYHIPDDVLERIGFKKLLEKTPARKRPRIHRDEWTPVSIRGEESDQPIFGNERAFEAPMTENTGSTIMEITNAAVVRPPSRMPPKPAIQMGKALKSPEARPAAPGGTVLPRVLKADEVETKGDSKAIKAKSAAQLEERLRAATQFKLPARKEADPARDAKLKIVKQRSVAAETLESRLKAAVEAKAQKMSLDTPRMEKQAVILAEKIQEEMYNQDLSVRRSIIKFIQEAIIQGIPAGIRIKISKKFFGS